MDPTLALNSAARAIGVSPSLISSTSKRRLGSRLFQV